MTVMLAFMKTMFVNGKGLAAWIALLLIVNMALPLRIARPALSDLAQIHEV